MTEPEWIDRVDLASRLAEEAATLAGDDLAWWLAHRIEPRIASCDQQVHFAVAESGDHVLTFFDDEDEFGVLTRQSNGSLGGYSLCGDLVNAVRALRLHFAA